MLFIGGLQKGHLKQAIHKWEDNSKAFHWEGEHARINQAQDILVRIAQVSKKGATFHLRIPWNTSKIFEWLHGFEIPSIEAQGN